MMSPSRISPTRGTGAPAGWRATFAALLLVAATTAAPAQDQVPPAITPKAVPLVDKDRVPDRGALRLLPPKSVTRHGVDTAAGRLDYVATAGTLPLYDKTGEQAAAVFYTSYVVEPPAAARRPVTFVFNGGPGAASAYLHLGLVGPRISELRRASGGPQLDDNPLTWLAFTDLVLIDPVGAGFSRAARADGGVAFWGVGRDAEAMATTIARWIANNGRSDARKFIVGESYGGFRAAKVARALRSDHGIAVAGVVMVSPLLEGNFTFGGTRFALGAAMQIPSLAAAELERTGAFTPERIAEAERFALNEYLTTLAGAPPRGDKARAFYARVAEITGMPLALVAQTRGFIRDHYVKHLRGAERLIVSRYDATFTSPDPHPEQPVARGPDPLLELLSRTYGNAMAVYVREELGYRTDLPYVLLSGEANSRWDWGRGGGRATASVDDDIRELLAADPSFRLLIAHGYTDMVTPYAVSRYVLDHLPDLPNPERAQLRVYRGGHMFYTDANSRRDFTDEARTFYAAEP